MNAKKKSTDATVDIQSSLPISKYAYYKQKKWINQNSKTDSQIPTSSTLDRTQNLFQFPVRVEGFLPTCFSAFIMDCEARNLSKGTIEFYCKKIPLFIEFLSTQEITFYCDIEPYNIRTFLLNLSKDGHNPGGVHCYYRCAKTFINWCEREFEPENWKNPFLKIKAPKVPNNILDPVDSDHVKSMMQTCRCNSYFDARDYAIFLVLLDTGLRSEEFLSLRIEDIDIKEKAIHILKGKGRKSRTVYISEKTLQAIQSYLDYGIRKPGYLWETKTGSQLTYNGLRSIVRRRAKRAGVPAPTLHSFRRYFALKMIRNGADIFSIQKLMGHSDISILQRYLKQTTEDAQKAHKTFGPLENENFDCRIGGNDGV